MNQHTDAGPDRARLSAVANPAVTPLLRTIGLSKRYGKFEAVQPIDLTIHSGDFFAILGPSGCGKTTLLRMIGGFVQPSDGQLLIDGKDMTRTPPEKRPTNMVFQGYGLFPHMNVRQNVGYGLRISQVSRDEVASRVDEALRLVQITALADRSVQQLSGGQQQRVSLARALVMRPRLLLLDEPLAALDLKLRSSMQEELRSLHREIGGTFVFVTHDQGEAMSMANRIAVMRDGAIVQEGSAPALYARPVNRFVATFIGETNSLPGQRRDGMLLLDDGISLPSPGRDGAVTLVIRPEAVRVGVAAEHADARLDATLRDRTFLGPHERLQIALDSGRTLFAHRPVGTETGPETGARLAVGWSVQDQMIFDDDPGPAA